MKKNLLKILTCFSIGAMSLGMLGQAVSVNAASLKDNEFKDSFEEGIGTDYTVLNDTEGKYQLFEKPGQLTMTGYDYANGFVHTKEQIEVPEGKSLVVQFDVVDATQSNGWFALAKGASTYGEAWDDMIYYGMYAGKNMVNEANGQTGYQEGTTQSAWANSHLYGQNSLQRQVYNADGSAQMYGSASSLKEEDLHLFYAYKENQIGKTGTGYVGFMGNGMLGTVILDNFKVGIADNANLDNLKWVLEDDFETADNWTIEEAATAKTLIGGAAKYMLADNASEGAGIRYNTKIERKEGDVKLFDASLDIEIQDLAHQKGIGLSFGLQDDDTDTKKAPFIGLCQNEENITQLMSFDGKEFAYVPLDASLVGSKALLEVEAKVNQNGKVDLIGKVNTKEIKLELDSVDGYVAIATLGGQEVKGSGQLSMTGYDYANGFVHTKEQIEVPEGKSLVVQFDVVDATQSNGWFALAKGAATYAEAWGDMIYYGMYAGKNMVNEANNQVGYQEGTTQSVWANSHLYGQNSLQRQVYNADGSAQMYGSASSLKEEDLHLFYAYKENQIGKTGTGYVGFMGNGMEGTVVLDNFKVGIADNANLDNLQWVLEDDFADLSNWTVEDAATAKTELVNVEESILPVAKAKINNFTVTTYKTVVETGRNLSEDFEGELGRHFYLESKASQKDPNGYVKVEDGVLNFQMTGDGTAFGPAYKYVNFELQYDIEMQLFDEDDDGNITEASKWAGLSIGRKSLDAAFWQGPLFYQQASTLDTLYADLVPGLTPGYATNSRAWAATGQDYFAPVNQGKVFTVNVRAVDGTVTYKVGEKGTDLTVLGVATGVDTDGYIAICTTEWGDFKIDNFSIVNLDDTQYLDSALNLNVDEGIKEAKLVCKDGNESTLIDNDLVELKEGRKIGVEFELNDYRELVAVKVNGKAINANEQGKYEFDLQDEDYKVEIETKSTLITVVDPEFGELELVEDGNGQSPTIGFSSDDLPEDIQVVIKDANGNVLETEPTTPGTYKIAVVLPAGYQFADGTNTKEVTYTIVARQIEEVTASIEGLVFENDGQSHMPDVKLLDKDGNEIARENYTISFLDENNNEVESPVEVGKYFVLVELDDNYQFADGQNQKKVAFEIKEKAVPVDDTSDVSSEEPSDVKESEIKSAEGSATPSAPATSEQPEPAKKKGCGGALATSGIISLLALAGALFLKKRK